MTGSGPATVTVADVGEHDLIDRITSRLPLAPDWLLVGPGDDGAVASPKRNELEVITTDASVEGVHFDRRFVPSPAIGHRALAVNLSDLAAMGATPRLATLSLAMPGLLPLTEFDGLVDGLLALARRHDTTVVGGNLSRSPGPLVVDVMVMGTVPTASGTHAGRRTAGGHRVRQRQHRRRTGRVGNVRLRGQRRRREPLGRGVRG